MTSFMRLVAMVAKAIPLALLLTGAAMADTYGAIAFSPATGANSYSYDYASRSGAEQRALSECNKRSRGCRVAIWFKNSCGALAIGARGWGAGYDASRAAAEQRAFSQCASRSGGCRVRVWACNTR